MQTERLAALLIACCCLIFNSVAAAQTLAELQGNDRLRIKTWIEPQENIVARQQLNLQIEIWTDKWFSGGTRIGHFEVPDAIVLQREKFAVNSTLGEHDKTWTIQLWTLVVYPQRGGLFEIPPIPLQLSIAGDNNQSVVGQAFTRALDFVASTPPAMLDKPSWLATDNFAVEESFDKSFDDLNAGDALLRTITLSAANLPAMMLPEVANHAAAGLAVYTKPPKLVDQVNRGDYIAERTEVFTYVFEQAGDYQIPAQTFHWWDLASQSAASVVLESKSFRVNGAASVSATGGAEEQLAPGYDLRKLLPLLLQVLAVLALLLIVWFSVARLKKHWGRHSSAKQTQLTEAALRRRFAMACRQNQPVKALGLLYQWLDNYGGNGFNGSIRRQLVQIDQPELAQLFSKVMRSLYVDGPSASIDLQLFADRFARESKKLDHATRLRSAAIELTLN